MKYLGTVALLTLALVAGVFANDLTGKGSETLYSQGTVKRLDIGWTSGTNGIVSSNVAWRAIGRLERVVIVPGTSTDVPTTAYDLTIDDENNIDVILGLGANLSSNAVANIVPEFMGQWSAGSNAVPVVLNNTLTVEITNAGSNKKGTISLYVRP